MHARGYVRAVGSTTNSVNVVWSAAVTGLVHAICQDGANQTTPAVSGFGASGTQAPVAGSSPATKTLTNSSISCAVGDMVNLFAYYQCALVVSMSGISSTSGTEVNQTGSGFHMGASYYDTCDSTSESANSTGTCPSFYYSGYGFYSPRISGVQVGFVVQQSGGGGPSPKSEPVTPGALTLTGFAPVGFRPRIPEPVTAGALHLSGFAPDYTIKSPPLGIAIPAGSLILTGFVPEYFRPFIRETIPASTLHLTGYTPEYSVFTRYVPEPVSAGSLILTGLAPEFTIFSRYIPTPIDQGALTLTGYAPGFNIFTGQTREEIPAGSLNLTGFAPEFRIPFIREPIIAGTLTLTGYAPEFNIPQDIGIEIPSNVIQLSGYAPGFKIPVTSVEKPTAGAKPRPGRIVIIGNRRYRVENNAQLSALLNDYLRERREQLAMLDILPDQKRRKRYQVLKTQIAVTEKRIDTLREDDDEELLLMMIA